MAAVGITAIVVGAISILNMAISSAGLEDANLVIPAVQNIALAGGALPVPPDGSPYQLRVSFEAASVGSGWPVNMELSLSGQVTD